MITLFFTFSESGFKMILSGLPHSLCSCQIVSQWFVRRVPDLRRDTRGQACDTTPGPWHVANKSVHDSVLVGHVPSSVRQPRLRCLAWCLQAASCCPWGSAKPHYRMPDIRKAFIQLDNCSANRVSFNCVYSAVCSPVSWYSLVHEPSRVAYKRNPTYI